MHKNIMSKQKSNVSKKFRGLLRRKMKGFTRPNFLKKNLGGFTIWELIIVIAIIALVSSLALAWTQSQRAKARDAERVSELNGLRTALQLYFMDSGEYPVQEPADWGPCSLEQEDTEADDYCPGMYEGGNFVLAPYISKLGDPMFEKGAETGGKK